MNAGCVPCHFAAGGLLDAGEEIFSALRCAVLADDHGAGVLAVSDGREDSDQEPVEVDLAQLLLRAVGIEDRGIESPEEVVTA